MTESVHAPSQLLQRHDDLFQGQHLLLAGQILDDYSLQLAKQCEQLTVVSSNYLNHKQLAAGLSTPHQALFSAWPELEQAPDALLLYMPKAKAEAAMLLSCLLPQMADNAEIFIVGENRGGVKASEKLLAEYGLKARKIDSARRCSLYFCEQVTPAQATAKDTWQQQFELTLPQGQLKVCSQPGVFNHGKLDAGTELLLAHLPKLEGDVLDFGCGAGIIGAALALGGRVEPHLLDVSSYAVASAQATLTLNGINGTVFASDGLSEVNAQYQYIVSNPPFHTGTSTDYSIVERFFEQAKAHLRANGELWLVANSFLPYEGLLARSFTKVELVRDNRQFKVLRACV